MTTTTSLPTRLISLTAAAVLVGLLSGCSGGGSDESAATAGSAANDLSGAHSVGDAPAASEDRGGAALTDGGGADDGGGTDRTSARVLPVERDIVYRGQVTVRVKDVARAAERVERMTLAMDGVVFAEETSRGSYRRGVGEAHLTLRVPPTQFGATLEIGRAHV